MALSSENHPLSDRLKNSFSRIGSATNELMYKLPIIGPIKRNVPGRKASLLLSTVIPLGVGFGEWRIYEGIRQTGIDPAVLGLMTLGIFTAVKVEEHRILMKSDWCSNIWTLGFIDIFRWLEHKEKNKILKKIYGEPYTALLISKLAALISYPATLKAMDDARVSQNLAYLSYITFVQNIGDILFAGLNEVELRHPGSIKREFKFPIKDIKW